ncbi:MAG: response regulator transcription factor [Clostridia bacterium]|nr:response regulator transcription factor [Clostridia bacterium]
MRILLAEDELSLSRAIVKILERSNFSVDAVYTGDDALDFIRVGNYDAAVLDIMMPGLDGISVLKEVRASGNDIPVLILSARSEVEDKVRGLDCGANDYLAKPFDARELVARIRAITRVGAGQDNRLRLGNVTLDRASFELSSPKGSFRLANKEFQMMELFLQNPGKIISSERFLEKIWGYDSDVEINVVWVYISYLRKKLSALGADIQIRASRNAGYSVEADL